MRNKTNICNMVQLFAVSAVAYENHCEDKTNKTECKKLQFFKSGKKGSCISRWLLAFQGKYRFLISAESRVKIWLLPK